MGSTPEYLPCQVHVAVESQAVAGDEVAVVDAQGTDLAVPDPDPRVRRPVTWQPESGTETVDDRLKS